MDCSKHVSDITIGEIWDHRHPPVIMRCPLKELSGENVINEGQVVKMGTANTIEPAATSDTPFGIALENVKAGDEFVNVLLHGTAKRSNVKMGSAALTVADINKLAAAGIYCLD